MSFETQPYPGELVNTGIHHGIRWCIMNGPFGLNGYVRLPEAHPWLNKGSYLEKLEGSDYPRVHGGITYGPDNDRWIGFDTAHAEDLFGSDISVMPFHYPATIHSNWTDTQVEEECDHLCDQVADAMRRD